MQMRHLLCILVALMFLAACRSEQTAPIGVPAIASATALPTLAAALGPTSAPTAIAVPPTTTPADALTATPLPTALPTATPLPTDRPAPVAEPTPAALRYVFPVRAKKYSISSSHHDYPAADIACPIGSEFVAVTSGIVDFVSRADTWPRTRDNADKGGLSVAIIGDDGVRYYGSHLSEVAAGIEPGVRVKAGQLLGLTGESGNAAGVYPQLHFGISHPTTPDDWQVRRGELWPQKYLKAWERGENLGPILP